MALSREDKSSSNSGNLPNVLKIIYTISLSEVSHFLDAALELLADESFHLPTKPNETCTNAAKRVMDISKNLLNRQSCCAVGLFPSLLALSMLLFHPTAHRLTRRLYGLSSINFRQPVALLNNGVHI